MFDSLKAPRNLTGYKLMQGVTDYGNLAQFNLFETGYSFLLVCQMPKFIEELAKKKTQYQTLIDNYKRILEFEFRGLDGLDDMTVDTLDLTNGITNLKMIGKVNQQSDATVTMQFFEKSGSAITKFHELFLTGLKDPMTQGKHYHGLIKDGTLEAGYENEVFTLLYLVTDNTMLQLERAYLLLCAQPTKADFSMYNSTKGDIQNKEISVEFNCFPVKGDEVYKKANEALAWMNNEENDDQIIIDSSDYKYTGIDKIKTGAATVY